MTLSLIVHMFKIETICYWYAIFSSLIKMHFEWHLSTYSNLQIDF